MKCPHCGMQQSDGVAFCDNCGAALGQMQPSISTVSMPTVGTFTPGTVPTPPLPAPPVVAFGATVCPSCGVQMVPGAAFCDNCGQPLGQSQPGAMPFDTPAPIPPEPEVVQSSLQTNVAGIQELMNCPSCGKQTPPGMLFCDNCGANLTAAAPLASPVQTQIGSQAEGELKCAQCGVVLEPGGNFCDNCGAAVQTGGRISRDFSAPGDVPFTPEGALFQPPAYASSQPPYSSQLAFAHTQVMPPDWGGVPPQQAAVSPSYSPAIPARLVVQGSHFPLPFTAGKTEWFVGRADPLEGIFPDIDLTNHGGDELGVSRRHARIYMQGGQFYVVDLRSTNHTFVNQQRLLPDTPQLLNHGDELRFGRVKLNFYLTVGES